MEYIKDKVLLTAKDINLSFNNKVVLKDINFQVRDIIRPNMTQGQVIALLGPSGVGKTQLIRILSGLHISGGTKTGDILIGLNQTPVVAGDMGIVPQDYYMPEHLKVGTTLRLAAKKNPEFKGDAKTITEAIAWYINAFDIVDHMDKYPIQLSGGQRQRAAISMQLLSGSDFLLMDEPFSGLDPLMIDKTTTLLQMISQSSELKTIIIVSHDLPNSVAISDTVFILSKRGRKPEEGATIVQEMDLIQRDLAWHPEIKSIPAFWDTIKEIKSLL